MGICDFCGTAISDCFEIRSADGKLFIVGCDCVHKTGDRGLRKVIDAQIAKVRRERSHARDDAKISAGRKIWERPEVKAAARAIPNPRRTWDESGMEGYVDFMFRCAGRRGMTEAAKYVAELAAKIDSAAG